MTPDESKLFDQLLIKADMFDYLCWRHRTVSVVFTADGTPCFGNNYADIVRVAMELDKQTQDGVNSL